MLRTTLAPAAAESTDEWLTRMGVPPSPSVPVALPAKPAPGAIAVVTHAVIKPHVIGFDPGGLLTDYVKRYEVLFAQGNDIEIRGSCESACTLVTSVTATQRKGNIVFIEDQPDAPSYAR